MGIIFTLYIEGGSVANLWLIMNMQREGLIMLDERRLIRSNELESWGLIARPATHVADDILQLGAKLASRTL